MIKLAINGIMGRMGQEVLKTAVADAQFEVIGGIDPVREPQPPVRVSDSPETVVKQADVVVDFSTPEGTAEVLGACLRHKKPLVTGTTGLDSDQRVKLTEAARGIAIVQAANFSIGINVLARLVELTADTLKDAADVEIVEIHHRMKKDAPSGTALFLAQKIADRRKRIPKPAFKFGRHGTGLHREKEIGIHSLRGGQVVGEHRISFLGENENIVLTHQALNRGIFAGGALRAARWVIGQPPGLYGMNDVLGF